MTGLVGGTNVAPLEETLDELTYGDGTKRWYHEHDNLALGLAYQRADQQGRTMWTDGARGGVIYGALTNLGERGWSVEDLFHRLLQRPAETAAALDGAFVIACQDPSADRHLVVTDKLGARPVFSTASGPFRYASAVQALLQYCDEPSVNLQAVSDMLLMGHLWGDRTLVEGIRAQRPATVVDVVDGDRSATRYWKPEYTERAADEQYLADLTDSYRQAVRRTSETLPSEVGIWLSGGLDSRTTTGALQQYRQPGGVETLKTYTYDANPPTNDNPRIARQVAQTLGVENQQVPLTAETVGENFERIIEATDGMLMWAFGANLSATYELEDPTPVMMEGMQGALLGDHLYRHHLHDVSSAVESQASSETNTSPEAVTGLLSPDVDPLDSFRAEIERTSETSVREQVLDIHFQNYYSRVFMPSNRLMRDRVGTRAAQVDGDYLELCAKLPRRFRKGALRTWGAPEGGVPFEPTRAKLGLIRRIDPDLADITYERSKVKPSWPYPIHVAGFVGNVLVNRLRSQPTYGSGQLSDFWIRDTETQLHDHVTRLVDDACSRDLFDADAVREVYDEHMDGANNAAMLSKITTIEHWLQTNLD
jgi:asparagine synthase (glutamine-hydrolysing)